MYVCMHRTPYIELHHGCFPHKFSIFSLVAGGTDIPRKMFILVYWYERPNSGTQKRKYTFIYNDTFHHRLFLPF